MESKGSVLVGRTLVAVEISKDQGAIRFLMDDGEVVATCDADCCSHTWIEHVELPPLPAKVTAVEEIEMPDQDHPEDADKEYVQYYGFKMTTDRGHLILDYRNESNGYYGGWLTWPGERHYGGVYGQNEPTYEWVSPDERSEDV